MSVVFQWRLLANTPTVAYTIARCRRAEIRDLPDSIAAIIVELAATRRACPAAQASWRNCARTHTTLRRAITDLRRGDDRAFASRLVVWMALRPIYPVSAKSSAVASVCRRMADAAISCSGRAPWTHVSGGTLGNPLAMAWLASLP